MPVATTYCCIFSIECAEAHADFCIVQQRAKEEREERRLRLGAAHSYIIDLAAMYFGMDRGAVEEFVIDTDQVF